MNDLLRQAHPNTLVPGVGAGPFCAHHPGAGPAPSRGQGSVSDSRVSYPSPFVSNSRCRVRMTTAKRLIGVPGAVGRPTIETGPPVSRHSSIQSSSLGQPVPCEYLASYGRWSDLVHQHGWRPVIKRPAMRPSCWDCHNCLNITGAVGRVYGEPYDQGKLEANRACTRRRCLISCASLVVGRKGMEGLQRFQPGDRV